MNGIDTVEWDPASDPHLPPPAHFDASTVVEGKAAAKALLQERLGLQAAPDVPLIGFIGRQATTRLYLPLMRTWQHPRFHSR